MSKSIEGLENVISNLNHEINGVVTRTYSGLLAAGALVEGEAKKNAPLVTGNLRGSGYHRGIDREPPAVEVGFGAAYAVFTHENIEQKLKGLPRPASAGGGKYWDKGGPKFLENAVIELSDKIVETVKRYAGFR